MLRGLCMLDGPSFASYRSPNDAETALWGYGIIAQKLVEGGKLGY